MAEPKSRSLVKSISYIVTHETLFFCLTWFITGQAQTAAVIALSGSVLEAGYYYLHERLWNRLEIKKAKKK